jgi:hypothetical protein
MATRTILIDDLDGSSGSTADVQPAAFALDGQAYEIDLSATHRAELAQILAPYMTAGRQLTPAVQRKRRPRSDSR